MTADERAGCVGSVLLSLLAFLVMPWPLALLLVLGVVATCVVYAVAVTTERQRAKRRREAVDRIFLDAGYPAPVWIQLGPKSGRPSNGAR